MITEEVPTPGRLLAIATQIVAGGATLARTARTEAITKVGTKSTDTDVVTAADHAVERYVIDAVHAIRPRDSILSEESGSLDGSPDSTVRWILDPIDGTVNYLYGIPHYGVSLAVEVAGEVVAGVVCNAATGVWWTAVAGGGAYRDGYRLSGSTETELSRALVMTGFGYDARRRAHQGRVLDGLVARVRDIRRMGASALDLCLAAQGAVDAFYEKGLQAWDLAAGGLIAREAGLIVSGLSGAPAGTDFVLAAPPALHGVLHEVLVDLDAAGGP